MSILDTGSEIGNTALMALEAIIGLEIHIQLKTQSKMFCQCANIYGDVQPNSAICPICLGYPGTLPVPNEQALEWTHVLGAALECELAPRSKFDRKSYFYPDLPKGYQISQFDQPFCGPGKLAITTEAGEHVVGITRIHLEEDAAKNTHPKEANYTLVDYNRAGTPLAEMVTEPDIRSPQEAKAFLQELQRIVRLLGISDADMEKGQMRCDANISLREKGNDQLHPKTEIKNVNSFRFVEKALEYEIKRQTKLHKAGEIPGQATRGFDSDAGKTYEQRTKEEAADYRYFPEPDIPPFEFSDDYFASIHQQVPELPAQKRERFARQYNVSKQQADILTSASGLSQFLENTTSELAQLEKEEVGIAPTEMDELAALATKVITNQIRDIMTDQSLQYEDLKITEANFAELIVLAKQGKINSNAIRPVLDEMQRTGGDPDPIIQNLGLEQVSGTDELEAFVDEVIKENPDVVERIQAGKDGAIQFLMGQVMAKSRGKADPKVVTELLRERLTK